MRILIRILCFWGVALPLFYVFGLPMLLDKLQTKARADQFVQCHQHLREQHLTGPTALLRDSEADAYCHCVSDGLTIERGDLVDMARHRQPERLNSAMKPVVEACNEQLKQSMSEAMKALPAPRVTTDANGVETVHFN